MKALMIIPDIIDLCQVGEEIIVFDNKRFSRNIKNDLSREVNTFRYDDGLIYEELEGRINVLNTSLQVVDEIVDADIKPGYTSLKLLGLQRYFLHLSKRDDQDNLVTHFSIIQNQVAELKGQYCGKFLNEKFRLNFKYEERYNPSSFSCSDITGSHAFFEYQCTADEEIYEAKFIEWNGALLFSLTRNKMFYLVMLRITTGELIWEQKISNRDFVFHREAGVLVSLWGNDAIYQDKPRQYQVIYLKELRIEIGMPLGDVPFFGVFTGNPNIMYVEGDMLYFADHRRIHDESRYTKKLGVFNWRTKQVVFREDLEEIERGQVSRIIKIGNRIYVRSIEIVDHESGDAEEKLFVFEE